MPYNEDQITTIANRCWVKYVARKSFKFDVDCELTSNREREEFVKYAIDCGGGELRWLGVKMAVEEFK